MEKYRYINLYRIIITLFVIIYWVECDKKVEVIKRLPLCGENEDYLPCLHPCPPDSCGINYREIDCAAPSPEIICSPGCRCSQGYLRDSNGKCIRSEKCPPHIPSLCGLHEVYDPCGPTCQDSCDKRMETSGCRQKCVAACFCIKGYIRDNDGECVKIEDCKSCNGDVNAHSGCNTQCNAYCDTYNKTNIACAGVCPIVGCTCNKGYVQDNNLNKCVKPEECTPKCGIYETYDKCGPSCQDSCNKRIDKTACREKCHADCFCAEGYIRDDVLNCLKIEDCRSCNNDPNARPGCENHCGNSCATYNRTDFACGQGCRDAGCVCNEGYVYDDAIKECVKPEQCSPICRVNEVFDKCGPTCEDRCEKRINPANCRDKCVAGCFCKEEYIRDVNGRCVKPNECSSCNGDRNARPGCGSACRPRCSNTGSDIQQRPAVACEAPCFFEGCDCIDGFIFDDSTKQCVKPEDCSPICRVNEVFDKCGPTCEDHCEKRANPANCQDKCVAGCFCKEGYIRDVNGRCVKPNECSSCNGDRNARPGCGSACRPRCSNTGSDIQQRPAVACEAPCFFEGCDCIDGFIFDDSTNQCVKPEDCSDELSCSGDRNATCVDCPNPCEPTCLNPNPPKICPKDCEECGCECKKGYLLDTNSDMCIRPLDCPKIYPCEGDENAEVVSCPEPCPVSCQHLNTPLQCSRPCKDYGCQCKPGFVLDEVSKKCVKIIKCLDIAKTPCNGDDNAELVTCPNPCAPTCQLPRPKVCTKACVFVGCQCKRGFIFDQETKKCVKPNKCPKVTTGCDGDPNAELVSCPNPCPANCKNPDRNIPCGAMCVDIGCQCKGDFVLNKDTGKCVKLEDCH